MTRATPHSDTCRQLYAEQRDQIANVEYGAKHNNPVSKALMEQMPALKIKLQNIEALGRYVAAKEAEDASRTDR